MTKRLNTLLLTLCLVTLIVASFMVYQVGREVEERGAQVGEINEQLSATASSISTVSSTLQEMKDISQQDRDEAARISRTLQATREDMSGLSQVLGDIKQETLRLTEELSSLTQKTVGRDALQDALGEALRDFAGGGGDISLNNPLPVLEAKYSVRRLLVDPDVEADLALTFGSYSRPVVFY
ncbi:MAG: hypothetical protein V3U31_08100, partial [Dehalococcoidia bacterium]